MADSDTSSPKSGNTKITKISGELKEVRMASMDSKNDAKPQKDTKTNK